MGPKIIKYTLLIFGLIMAICLYIIDKKLAKVKKSDTVVINSASIYYPIKDQLISSKVCANIAYSELAVAIVFYAFSTKAITKTKLFKLLSDVILFAAYFNICDIVCGLLKMFVDEPRPNFISMCKITENKLYYTHEDCKVDQLKYSDLISSFPSGHSSIMMSTILISWYFLFKNKKQGFILYALGFIIFTVVSVVNSIVVLTRIADHKHHIIDIVVPLIYTPIIYIVMLRVKRKASNLLKSYDYKDVNVENKAVSDVEEV